MNPFVEIIKKEFWGRIVFSVIVVVSFLLVLVGIEHAMLGNHQLDQDWKEILMLLLGAMIGGFSKVIDFWFKDHAGDKQLLDKIQPMAVQPTTAQPTANAKTTQPEVLCQCEDCKAKRAAQQNQTH